MPQRDLLLPWLSALDNAALALRIARVSRARARAAARAALFAELGLEGFEHARARASCRAGCASAWRSLRTLLSGKPVLCLDEPFGALDAITRAEMQEWLAGALAREPRTVVLVTHDVEEAVLLADRVLVLSPRPGRVIDELEVDAAAPARRAPTASVIALRERALRLLARGAARVSAAPARALLPPLGCSRCALLGAWELYVDSARASASCCPRRTRSPASLWDNARLLAGTTSRSPPRRSCSGSRWRWRSASRWPSRSTSRRSLRRAVYPLAVGSQAVPVAGDRACCSCSGGASAIFPKLVVIVLICFFPVLVTTVDGLAALDPDAAEAAAHARCLALAGLPLRRAAGGAAGGAQRRADRARGRRDRRLHRRDAARPRAAPTPGSATRSAPT